MGKTGAQRQAEYRARLKSDPSRLAKKREYQADYMRRRRGWRKVTAPVCEVTEPSCEVTEPVLGDGCEVTDEPCEVTAVTSQTPPQGREVTESVTSQAACEVTERGGKYTMPLPVPHGMTQDQIAKEWHEKWEGADSADTTDALTPSKLEELTQMRVELGATPEEARKSALRALEHSSPLASHPFLKAVQGVFGGSPALLPDSKNPFQRPASTKGGHK